MLESVLVKKNFQSQQQDEQTLFIGPMKSWLEEHSFALGAAVVSSEVEPSGRIRLSAG